MASVRSKQINFKRMNWLDILTKRCVHGLSSNIQIKRTHETITRANNFSEHLCVSLKNMNK